MVKLQDYISSLYPLPRADKIKAIKDLLPGLRAEQDEEHRYFVEHPDYEGIGGLIDLGLCLTGCGYKWNFYNIEYGPFDLEQINQSKENPIYEVEIWTGGTFYQPPGSCIDLSGCNLDAENGEDCPTCLALKEKKQEQVDEGLGKSENSATDVKDQA